MRNVFSTLGLDTRKIIVGNAPAAFGKLLKEYFRYRADRLNKYVMPRLMKRASAKIRFDKLKRQLNPTCSLPENKQKGKKKQPAYFTGIINMLIEANAGNDPVDYDPKVLITIKQRGLLFRTLSRRVDGAFPSAVNPIAIWEIKEYYYTTTFGSRVADAVYESLLDGYELEEVRTALKQNVGHYLMVDDYFTWWILGKSYLCRICDMLHMGLLTEALFGREVVDRIPPLVKAWRKELHKTNSN